MITFLKISPLILLAACSHQQYKAPEGIPLSNLHIQTASKQAHQHEVLFTDINLCREQKKISLGNLNKQQPISVGVPSQQLFAFVINSYANLKLTKNSDQQKLDCSTSIEFTPELEQKYFARHWVSQDAKECTIRLFDHKGKILPASTINLQDCVAQK